MRLLPRRYEFCIQCREQTVQWLVKIRVNKSAGNWPLRPVETYRCQQCGTENL